MKLTTELIDQAAEKVNKSKQYPESVPNHAEMVKATKIYQSLVTYSKLFQLIGSPLETIIGASLNIGILVGLELAKIQREIDELEGIAK